ncbi:uncharacterized protein LOC100145131 isoform X1 [Xenopus tropicalis]|uniref:Uncharacterized protein LOC100145131 isoform X1 n=2 Tax=Xenopus tropicalis TaxID=8364 RepID=A0A8J0SXE9_XENTR|nr:uncharacterized protein LOC100145131 isoform X1 [Xenopus tropicalis]XP_012825518.2 uncharacterized protein LOC100145131 isoform X1 [Xenopus tropicalis]
MTGLWALKMAQNSGLFHSEDPAVWQKASDIYWDVIAAKGAKQKKLVSLDKWFQEELPPCIAARPHKHLTREELVKLMEWKLTRGKFRPRLQQLVASNPDGAVETCTEKAFKLLPEVSAAINELCQLKGIGPATASAVLAAGAPELTAFMADEAVESIPGLTPVQYTLKHYLRYLEELRKKAAALSTEGSSEKWTPHQVELCLWAWGVARKLCPNLLGSQESGKIEERPKKKLKTK